MRISISVLALALGLCLLGGCGGSSSPPSQRKAVAVYLKHVNAVEAQLAKPLRSITEEIVKVSQAGVRRHGFLPQLPPSPSEEQGKLLSALRQVRRLDAQLKAVPAPSAAARLRGLLLRLVGTQADLTEQTARLVVFLPAFSRVLRPLGPATARLERVLAISTALGASGVAAVLSEKAAALRSFDGSVSKILVSLRRLDPPRVSLPEYRSETSALRAMRASSMRLASALDQGATQNLGPLLTAFDRAAAAPGSITAQRAQIAAVRRYDRELGSLNQLTIAAERERLRLSNRLG